MATKMYALAAFLLYMMAATVNPARADTFAMKNQVGGAIVLTNSTGDCPAPYKVAYATEPPDIREEGCWDFNSDDPKKVDINWPGETLVYPLSGFKKLSRSM